ncbi:MAG: translation initiation factor IF-2 [Candidatus Paceibacterota bacterium]
MPTKNVQPNTASRPPVVVIMGHVDHGKSTLLDYIRKSNIVSGEAGGITQRISAYEVTHKDEHGANRLITFLDTPGHEAFSKMRARGATTADIAILVVSAEDSVKTQTLEAYQTIIDSKLPYIVAINKIDRPNANVEKVKMDLVEKGIYLEGFGGDIPFVPISAKEGTGVNDLLDMIILVADLNSFTGATNETARGVIIEAHRDPKRGVSATGIIKNGTVEAGMFIVAGTAITNTRIMENFLGKPIKTATMSSPISLVGFDVIPDIGSTFETFHTKKEAEQYIKEMHELLEKAGNKEGVTVTAKKIIPLIIKTDVAGTIEALEKEITKINTDDLAFRIISKGVGAINESDLKLANSGTESLIVGFNVKIDNGARDLNESLKITVQTFDIIYKLTDWLKEVAEERRPRSEVMETIGTLKVLRTFSATKDKQVIGGKVTLGHVSEGGIVRVIRRDFEIGRGKIVGVQINKTKVKQVEEGTDCGLLVEAKVDIASGDVLEVFTTTIK